VAISIARNIQKITIALFRNKLLLRKMRMLDYQKD